MKLKELVRGKGAKRILVYFLDTYDGEFQYKEHEVTGSCYE